MIGGASAVNQDICPFVLAEGNLSLIHISAMLSFPVKYFKIANGSKFKELEHKHYLGSIMSLGLKREILGDLIVKDGICYGIINEELFTFLKENLKMIGKIPVEAEEIISGDIPETEFKELVESIASLRLDAVSYTHLVLITGESGTGKELYASAIHNFSPRKDFPFIPVNCASFEKNLIESELFGYEEGSFTGAKKNGKTGLFQLAQGGTLFLDEIGELEYGLQGKLLRVPVSYTHLDVYKRQLELLPEMLLLLNRQDVLS